MRFRKFIALLVCCFMLLTLLAACDTSNNNGGDDVIADGIDKNDMLTWFDEDKTDLPSLEQCQNITVGMSINQVIRAIGKPQRDIGYGAWILQFDVEDGSVLTVLFDLDSAKDGATTSTYDCLVVSELNFDDWYEPVEDIYLSRIYPWIDELREDAITQVRYEQGAIGVAPGCMIDISYSTNSEDIANAYRILFSPLQAISREEGEICGGGYVMYDFFTGADTTSFSIRINNKILYFQGRYYRFVDKLYKLQHSYLNTHSFVTYWDMYEIYTYATESVKIGEYNGLSEFEFKPYDGLIENAPSFRLVCDGVELLILSSNQFTIKGDYNTVSYQITGYKDFSFLFPTDTEVYVSEQIVNQIIDAVVDLHSKDRYPVTEEEISLRFYGAFDGVYVLFVDAASWEYDAAIWIDIVADVEFVYSCGQRMVVYSNGEFYSLSEAYDNQILSQQDLLTVQQNYIADHQYLY